VDLGLWRHRCAAYQESEVSNYFWYLISFNNPLSEFKPIQYPAPQPPLSTDLLTAVSLTATNHTENQPVHLQLPYMGVDTFDSEAVSFFYLARWDSSVD
jgi:hypothetical protein